MNEFAIHVLVSVAMKEAKAISTRTKESLAAKKARGFMLSNPENFTDTPPGHCMGGVKAECAGGSGQ
ncbi:hypothetical protein MTX78_24025 (plasmid) [Hymenobacter tibetensis]|uniref:Resolvase/invertase-type recombinase catalytic domain-containing protein n=1 Tax=Hymenobacter tibetensis TaxID=497967 RepID=A0ABY4D739_9BACT|nr:recombinase family protein [Hymenobacter tibetensis]UOG77415.1 hypothetical protein MTX78_24025 [Hymenobacter tibetensis]